MNSSRENIFNGKTSNDHRTLSENVMYADGFLWQLLFAVIMYALKMSQPKLSAWAESSSKTFLKSQPLQDQSSLKPSLCSLEVFFESLFEILCGSSWKFPFKFSLCFVTWPCSFGLSAKLSVSSLPISFVSFLSKLCLSSSQRQLRHSSAPFSCHFEPLGPTRLLDLCCVISKLHMLIFCIVPSAKLT